MATDDEEQSGNVSDHAPQVEIFHRVNKLKQKTGASPDAPGGYIDDRAVEQAQQVVKAMEKDYKAEVLRVLQDMDEAWQCIQNAVTPDETATGHQDLYHSANHIKDLAAMYGYDLMQHFARSLRDFAEKIDVDKPKHRVIVQAHVDVMWMTYNKDIKGQGGAAADELKEIVAQAIEQNF